jgi:hypothetical protein
MQYQEVNTFHKQSGLDDVRETRPDEFSWQLPDLAWQQWHFELPQLGLCGSRSRPGTCHSANANHSQPRAGALYR